MTSDPKSAELLAAVERLRSDYDYSDCEDVWLHEKDLTVCAFATVAAGDGPLTFDTAIQIARDCLHRNGGSSRTKDREIRIFHQGIRAVIFALEGAIVKAQAR